MTAELTQMVGKNRDRLWQEHDRILHAVAKATREASAGGWIGDQVWKFNTQEHETRHVIFFQAGVTSHPFGNAALVVMLDSHATLMKSWVIPSGYRLAIRSATMLFDEALQTQVINMSLVSLKGRDVTRLYLALMDTTLFCIRIEDSHGNLTRNNYDWAGGIMGSPLPARTLTEWTELLNSPQLPRRLAALTFLSGTHVDGNKPPKGKSREAISMAKTAQALLQTVPVQKQIAICRQSPNTWLKQAAEQVTLPLLPP